MSLPSMDGAGGATVDGAASAITHPHFTPESALVPGDLIQISGSAARTCVLFVGHGSRRGGANREFEGLVGHFSQRHPGLLVGFGYIELAQPDLPASIASAVEVLERAVSEAPMRLVLVPLFLLRAGHCKNDLPIAADLARAAFPKLEISVAEPLGVDMRLVELAWKRACAVAEPDGATAILFVGRGSSDPGANADFYRIARLLFEGQEIGRVEPCFIGITEPLVPEALEQLARLRPARIIVVPYILFAGRLMERVETWIDSFAKQHPWIPIDLAQHLDADEQVLAVLESRTAAALGKERLLDCDACTYRKPMPGRFHEAGGLRALLWSLRHSFTHAQAMPAEHAHPALRKQVLVCGNADCADRGSVALIGNLRREIKQAGAAKQVRITRTSCMGRCGEGPTVVVYPDGIWYREVQADDAAELVSEHLLGDRLVGRLVDNIMQ